MKEGWCVTIVNNVSGIARLGSQNDRHLGWLQEGMPQGPGVGPGLSTAHGVWSLMSDLIHQPESHPWATCFLCGSWHL